MRHHQDQMNQPPICAFELLEERQHFSVYTVTNTHDTGAGSFREAILDVNADPAPSVDTIAFAIGSGGTQSITLKSALPTITHSVTIDGHTQDSAVLYPIALTGSGLTLSASNSTVRALSITTPTGNAITLQNGNSDTVQDCDLAATNGSGIEANKSSNDLIGMANVSGSSTGGNIIFAGTGSKDAGVYLTGNCNSTLVLSNSIQNSAIGVEIDSKVVDAVMNNDSIAGTKTDGILDAGSKTTIENTTITGSASDGVLEEGNHAYIVADSIQNNQKNGIEMVAGSLAGETGTGCLVMNNFIDHNTQMGVLAESSDNTIGSLTAGRPSNQIAYNGGYGVEVTNKAVGVTILGNAIVHNTSGAIKLKQNGNNLTAAPVITNVTYRSGEITITGTYHGSDAFFKPTLEFFSASSYVVLTSGPDFYHESNLETDANGNLSFSLTFASVVSSGVVTATATDSHGDTSALSNSATIIDKIPLPIMQPPTLLTSNP